MTIIKKQAGPRMSQIVIHGETAYLSGQVGEIDTDITTQTQSVLAKIEALLAEAGSSKEHLLSATIWLKTMDDFAAMNSVWDEWVKDIVPPARACGESRLAHDSLLIEITITAAIA